MSFINNPDFLKGFIIFMILFTYSLEIINVVVPDPNIPLGIVASFAAAAAVNPSGIETLLSNSLSVLKAIQVLLMVIKST